MERDNLREGNLEERIEGRITKVYFPESLSGFHASSFIGFDYICKNKEGRLKESHIQLRGSFRRDSTAEGYKIFIYKTKLFSTIEIRSRFLNRLKFSYNEHSNDNIIMFDYLNVKER